MLKKIIYIFMFLSPFFKERAFAQINLVSNPSFEIISLCPTSGSQLKRAVFWDTLKAGGGGNPDLYNECSSFFSDCSVPMNNMSTCCPSFQYARSGAAYAGLHIFDDFVSERREYMQTKLNGKLVNANNYCVKLYVNLINGSKYYCNSLGAYLDSGNVHANYFRVANVNPQILNLSQQLIDTLNWMKVEGAFTAIGIEEYLTIGNFFSDATSDGGVFINSNKGLAYYYIDDVSVIDISTPAYAGNDTSIALGDSVFIGRQPEIGLNEDCIWFVNGNPIDTIAGMWVMPDTTTIYVLQQTICGTVNYDTVTVIVDPVGNKKLKAKGFGLAIYPNPNTGKFIVQNTENIEQYILTVTNVLGQIIYSTQSDNTIIEVDLNGEAKGIYIITIKKAQISQYQKVIIK